MRQRLARDLEADLPQPRIPRRDSAPPPPAEAAYPTDPSHPTYGNLPHRPAPPNPFTPLERMYSGECGGSYGSWFGDDAQYDSPVEMLPAYYNRNPYADHGSFQTSGPQPRWTDPGPPPNATYYTHRTYHYPSAADHAPSEPPRRRRNSTSSRTRIVYQY
ncbi:hypothetical protein JCM10212_004701 [Sporobolomyces blumeae]